MDLSNIILGGGGLVKQLANTTPDQVTGLQAVSSEDGILLSVDQPTEESYEYLKDYWVTFKLASEGEIQHPYDGEHIIFAKPPFIPGTVISFISLKSISMLNSSSIYFSSPARLLLCCLIYAVTTNKIKLQTIAAVPITGTAVTG